MGLVNKPVSEMNQEEKVQAFDRLPHDIQLKIMVQRMDLMAGMLKDIKINMDNFWIKNGTMTKDSMVYTEFSKKYNYLFGTNEPKK